MLPIKKSEIERWRFEIEQTEDFREKHFGVYSDNQRTGAGENIDYFETGLSAQSLRDNDVSDPRATLNIVFPIVKNIIPSLYFQNPKVLVFPNRPEDEDSSPIAGEILNYFNRELEIKTVNQQIIFDAFVLGIGVCKIGYSTKFGADIPDEEIEKERAKQKERTLLEKLGLKKPKPEEKKENMDLNEFIRNESPYIVHISPFDFGIDPRATSIHDASYVYHKLKKTLKQVKSNKNYSNTRDLEASELEGLNKDDLTVSEIENFQTIDLYEIHYKTDTGINILTLAKDQKDSKAIYHEKSPYEIDGFQFEVLTLNKHAHALYPISDITLVRGLEDRVNNTFDSILDQVDKFVPKIIAQKAVFTAEGQKALTNGDIGGVCWTNDAPEKAVRELSMTQVKGDLSILIDKIIDVMSLITGLTKAQLTGLTSAETATEAKIGQSGQNLRRSDQSNAVVDFVNRQNRKFWQVIAQFVDLEELQLITGEGVVDEFGKLRYNWLNVDPAMREKLLKGEFSFDIETGSSQRPNIEILRQQVTNVSNLVFNPVVKQLLAQEGTNLSLTEIARANLKMYPEVFKNTEKILQRANPQQQMMAQMPQQGGSGENTGAVPNMQRRPPTMTSMEESVMGESSGGV